ncbi:phospholipase A2 inhibitor and Ly6/PLAUR domain-containing protein-like [Paroedura picta]|uniref:phospholipase A2 inhibitor and Ly6/PLAUR domain-containing protein-like n=1 Tax=Paroedura picta TaxID=143630 RepID=UPI004055FD4A
MKTLLSTCLLWALFSTGASLECYACASITGRCADSEIQQCSPGEDACVSIKESVTLPLIPTYIIKACVPSSLCKSGNYSITTSQNVKVQVILRCCKNDLCNNGSLRGTQIKNMIPNGYLCPACFAVGRNNCQPVASIACTGKETICLNFSGSVTLEIAGVLIPLIGAVQGCTIPNSCANHPLEARLANRVNISITRLECSSSTIVGTPLTNSTLDYATLPFPG